MSTGSLQAPTEATQRISSPFHMRIVGREHADVVANLGDDPAGVLVRIWSDPNLPRDVLARWQLETSKPLLILGKGLLSRVERINEPRKPRASLLNHSDPESRMAVEHPVDDQRGQALHHGVGNGHVIDGAKIPVATVEVRHGRETVFEKSRID